MLFISSYICFSNDEIGNKGYCGTDDFQLFHVSSSHGLRSHSSVLNDGKQLFPLRLHTANDLKLSSSSANSSSLMARMWSAVDGVSCGHGPSTQYDVQVSSLYLRHRPSGVLCIHIMRPPLPAEGVVASYPAFLYPHTPY